MKKLDTENHVTYACQQNNFLYKLILLLTDENKGKYMKLYK